MEKLIVENDERNNNWGDMAKALLNMKGYLSLVRTSDRRRMMLSGWVWSSLAYRHGGGRGRHSTVLCSDHRCDAAGIGASSPGNVVFMVLVSLRQISFGEIVDVAAFDLVGEAILHGALIDGRAEQSACNDV